MNVFKLLCVVAGLLPTGCSNLNIRVDSNPPIDYDAMRTWDWRHDNFSGADDPLLAGRDLEARLRGIIQAELESQGLRNATDTPDFLVGYTVALRRATGIGGMEGGGLTPGPMTFYVGGLPPDSGSRRGYEAGFLRIAFLNPENNWMIWRAQTETEVHLERTPADNERLLRKAVKEMIARFKKP